MELEYWYKTVTPRKEVRDRGATPYGDRQG